MLTLTQDGLRDRSSWLARGYRLPAFDRESMIRRTAVAPEWVHFGAGNIFRAFQCAAAQKLLEAGAMDTGIIAVEGYDYEIVEKGYRPCDNLSLLVTLHSSGSVDKTVIGSIAESRILDRDHESEYRRLQEIFASPSLRMASFTITEKGYALTPAVEEDFSLGPEKSRSYIGKVAALLWTRYKAGCLPIAMVSMDNCSHNGDKLKTAMLALAEGWKDKGFQDYLKSGAVSFPWTMIDKITPRPDASVEEMLRADGLSGLEPVVTSRKTYIAPFVNAEESEYLVIEDAFPNSRPPLEKAGMIMTDRETVDRVERMKVCTCLNPLHTSLAIFGCLLGYTRISDEMKDDDLVHLIRVIGYQEGLPVVTDPKVLSPKEFIDTVVNVRLPNPFLPDTPQRIACDTSQKIPIRFGETLKACLADPGKNVRDLEGIPLVISAWFRYLLAVDDEGKPMEVSPDPMAASLRQELAGVTPGMPETGIGRLRSLLARKDLFGIDLVAAGLEEKIEAAFLEMLSGPGSVRAALHKRFG